MALATLFGLHFLCYLVGRMIVELGRFHNDVPSLDVSEITMTYNDLQPRCMNG